MVLPLYPDGGEAGVRISGFDRATLARATRDPDVGFATVRIKFEK